MTKKKNNISEINLKASEQDRRELLADSKSWLCQERCEKAG